MSKVEFSKIGTQHVDVAKPNLQKFELGFFHKTRSSVFVNLPRLHVHIALAPVWNTGCFIEKSSSTAGRRKVHEWNCCRKYCTCIIAEEI